MSGLIPLPPPAERLVEPRTQSRLRQIFCNRNLRMESIEAIGFDMDYTLCVYNQQELEELSIACTLAKLVQDHGYEDGIASVHVESSFAVRGLVIDKEHGHVLKMDRHGHVGRGYHGYQELSRDERHELYARRRIDLSSERFVWVDTLFSLPDAALYAALVDYFQRKRQSCDFEKLFSDIRNAIDESHRDGSIKDVISSDPGRYLVRDPDLAETLHKFRSAGKKLFLLTNSEGEYTETVMSYLLSGALAEYPSWRHYFDVAICFARKPRFFTHQEPFLLMKDQAHVVSEADTFERGKIYLGGNFGEFERRFGYGGDGILYVGDHIYGDMLRVKKGGTWRTAMIIQEMERELDRFEATLPERQTIAELELRRAALVYDTQNQTARLALAKRRGIADTAIKALRLRMDALRREHKRIIARLEEVQQQQSLRYNPWWGSIFHEANELSKFGAQVEEYAGLYTGRVSNFLYYSPVHYYVAPPELMPHER